MTSSVSWAEYKRPLGLSLGITALVWILLFTIVIFDPNTHSAALLPSRKDDTRTHTPQACPFTPCSASSSRREVLELITHRNLFDRDHLGKPKAASCVECEDMIMPFTGSTSLCQYSTVNTGRAVGCLVLLLV